MNEENLKPERLQILNFLEKIINSQFVIPVYQRNYIWQSKKQVKKLLNDFKSVLNGSKERHFIGVMMYLTIQKSIGFYELSVVDGQQRVITIFLILQALKEIAKDNGNIEFSTKIEETFLTNSSISDETQKLKLKPLVSDDDVYRKIIMGQIDTITKEEKKSNVYLNYIYIKNFFREQYGMYSIEKILESLNKFYFVAIPLRSTDNAQEIFETINSAGAELSKADLIRNYILMNMNSDEQETLYNNYWQPLELMFLNGGKIENFFRMFLANQVKELANMDTIYEEFQKWFIYEKNENGRSNKDILEIIYKYAQYYNELFIKKTSHIEPVINKSLNEFKKSTIEPTAPLLMEIYSLYETKDPAGERLVSAEAFKKIIDLLNSYNIRRNVCNLRTGVLTRIIPPMLRNILEDCNGDYSDIYNITVKNLVDKNVDKASFMPDDNYMKANLMNINAYSLRAYVKIAFEKIESYNNPAVVDFSNLSIEHLMPQTPTPEWIEALNITSEEYDANLHRLGNLTLATHNDNSKMSNNPFEFKKEILSSTSHLKMNEQILNKEGWSINDINERTVELIDKICKLYPYVRCGTETVKKYSIYYNKNESNVTAYIYEDGMVEIQADSYFEKNSYNETEIEDLIEEGIISSRGSGYLFNDIYTFESLKKATEFITNDSVNEWEEWTDNRNFALSFDIRAKVQNAIRR